MKKRIIRTICLGLCALLLCSCAPAENTQQEKPFELPKLPEGMHNVPEAYAMDRLGHSRIWFAGAHVELFNMLNPDTYVYYQSPISSAGGREVRISGPGCEEFVNSEIAANDWYDYKYKTEYFDLRRSDPIPRKPETKVSFEDGITMRVLHSEYPAESKYTQAITYTLEASERVEYDRSCSLHKYVDGEWLCIISKSYVEFATHCIEKDTTMYFNLIASEYLGEGLYRVEHDGKYYAEFVVRGKAKAPDMTEYDFQGCNRANVFCRVGLPLNCRISAEGLVGWPYLDRSYTKVMDGDVQDGKLMQWLVSIRELPESIDSLSKFLVPNDDLKAVISPYEAAEILLPELQKLEGDVLISDVEYRLAWPDTETDILCPVWRFTVERGEEVMYFLVESRTGELL